MIILQDLINDLNTFRGGNTAQNWRKDNPAQPYSCRDFDLVRIDSSNKSGGKTVNNGKQWSIIVKEEGGRHIDSLQNFQKLKKAYNIALTDVKKGKNKGCKGIRIYRMSKNPTYDIVKKILDYITQ